MHNLYFIALKVSRPFCAGLSFCLYFAAFCAYFGIRFMIAPLRLPPCYIPLFLSLVFLMRQTYVGALTDQRVSLLLD